MHVLSDYKLLYDDVDVMEFARSWKPRKKWNIKVVGVVVKYLKYLSQRFKRSSASVLIILYIFRREIFLNCGKEVLKYLEKFYNVNNLKSLEECLDKIRISHSTLSNDLIYMKGCKRLSNTIFHNNFTMKCKSIYSI